MHCKKYWPFPLLRSIVAEMLKKTLMVWILFLLNFSALADSCQQIDHFRFGHDTIDWEQKPATTSYKGRDFAISYGSVYPLTESDFQIVFPLLYEQHGFTDFFGFEERYEGCHDGFSLYIMKNIYTQKELFVVKSHRDFCDGGNSLGFVLTKRDDLSTIVGRVEDSRVHCF